MTGTTTEGLRYPSLTPDAPNGPAAFQQLAEDVGSRFALKVTDETALLALTGMYDGMRVKMTTTGETATYDAASGLWQGYWKTRTPTLVGSTTANTLYEAYRVTGKNLEVEGLLTLNAAASAVITLSTFAAAVQTAGLMGVGTAMLYDTSVGSASPRGATVRLKAASTVSFLVDALTTAAEVTTAVPWTWATGDSIGYRYALRLA